MGSCAMIYVPSFIKVCSGIRKLIREYTDTHTHTHTQQRDLIGLHFFERRNVG
jgi:hypothetical protein